MDQEIQQRREKDKARKAKKRAATKPATDAEEVSIPAVIDIPLPTAEKTSTRRLQNRVDSQAYRARQTDEEKKERQVKDRERHKKSEDIDAPPKKQECKRQMSLSVASLSAQNKQ